MSEFPSSFSAQEFPVPQKTQGDALGVSREVSFNKNWGNSFKSDGKNKKKKGRYKRSLCYFQ